MDYICEGVGNESGIYVIKHEYRIVQATRILRTLIRYVKALQKDRIHIMNRYRHQLQSSPSDAEASRPHMIDRLVNSDRQLTAAMHMLDRLSRYKEKIMKQIGNSYSSSASSSSIK